MLILASCSRAIDVPETAEPAKGIEGPHVTVPVQTASDMNKMSTRAHWTDNNDGTAGFVWDENSDMVTAIKHGEDFVQFYEDKDTKANFYSMSSVSPKAEENAEALVSTLHGILLTPTEDNLDYNFPVAENDPVYCFSPVNDTNSSVVTASNSSATVTAKLPGTFTLSATDKLDELKDYSYIYGSTTLSQVNKNGIASNGAEFDAAVAVLRFCLTDKTDTDIKVTSIKMASQDGSKLFPNQLVWTAGAMTPMAEPADKSGYYDTVQVQTGDTEGVTIAKNDKGTFYMYALPLDDAYNYDGKKLVFTVESNYLTYSFTLSASKLASAATGNKAKFEAGKLYTFNMSLNEKNIELSTIEIADCKTYDVSTEQTTVVVLGGDADWSQTEDVSASMEFIGLDMTYTDPVTKKEYDVLWGTCNLGAKESIETGRLYSWGEYLVKTDANYSPSGYIATVSTDLSGTADDTVRKVMGNGHWQWIMPTQAMWQELLNNCTWEWITVKKTSAGDDSEENLDFDASVWKISRKDAEHKIIGTILLPITGFMGEKIDATGTYGKNNVARCNYWTSTPVTNEAGATQTSYALTTIYHINGNTGTMSDPVLTEQQRYQGFAIRPVLLKEKTNQ